MSRRGTILWGVFALVFALWLIFLRPTVLGGSASYVVVSGDSMKPTLANRDLVILRKHAVYKVGDVIAYRVPEGQGGPNSRIIHRIIGGSAADGYVTRGDNRNTEDPWRPQPSDIVGSRAFHVSRLGYVFSTLKAPAVLIGIGGLFVLTLLWSAFAARHGATAARGAGEASNQIAARVRQRYKSETDPAVRRGIRMIAFEIAMAYGAAEPGFDKGAFLDACGIGAEP